MSSAVCSPGVVSTSAGHVQQDEFGRAGVAGERRQGALVVGHQDAVHGEAAAVTHGHRQPGQCAPHTDRTVHRPGHRQLAVRRPHAGRHLQTHTYCRIDKYLDTLLQCFDAVGWAAGRASGL